jgi:predicted ATPase
MQTSLVKTEGIFKLAQEEEVDTIATSSVSSNSTLSFPTAVSNSIVSSLGVLSWDEQLDAIAEDGPKLDFLNLKVIGRDEEIAQLQAAFDRAAAGHCEAVELYGYAGTGKSTLVERAFREYVFDRDGFFVMGKFEQLRKKEPYSAIMEAFADICDLVIETGDTEQVRNAIHTSMGSDADILCRLVGESLSQILQYKSKKVRFQALSMKNAFARLKILCRSFIRAVCTEKHPLVLFLDDIQFADKSSLKLLKSLLKDTTACHVLIVFSYREEGMTSDLANLLSIFDTSDEEKKHNVLPCTKIHVTNMDLDAINEVIAEVTNLNLASTRGLAEIVEQKTMGNVFFVLQYLDALQRDGFVNKVNEQWSWELKDIQNVAKLVTAKVSKQKKNVRLVLKLAACLGSRFSVALLEEICYEQFINNPKATCTEEHCRERFAWFLSIANNEGLIEKCGKTAYKFVSETAVDSGVSANHLSLLLTM